MLVVEFIPNAVNDAVVEEWVEVAIVVALKISASLRQGEMRAAEEVVEAKHKKRKSVYVSNIISQTSQ